MKIKQDFQVQLWEKIPCVMCGNNSEFIVFETSEALCKHCYNVNLEARQKR
jgi:hypothetical protein